MLKVNCTTRRDFLMAAGAAVAAPYVITSAALGNADRPPASERVVMGGVGVGDMGSGDQGQFLSRGDVQYVAVCDARKDRCQAAKRRADDRYQNHDCKEYGDFRELLARKDIDAIHCATPDHWHALVVIHACRAGKDVYCQKPETRTLGEGSLMVETARRYGRVVSGGSQRVLEDYRPVVNACWDGTLGQVNAINVAIGDVVGPLSPPCNLLEEPVPPEIDWEMWLGPAPWAPYNHSRCSSNTSTSGGSWRSYADYSGGGMTDWGAHHFGGAIFALDIRELQPVEVLYSNDKDGKCLTFRYPNGKLIYHNKPKTEAIVKAGFGNAVQICGIEGGKRPPKTVPSYKGQGGIYGDFIHCVKTREKPFRDIEFAVNTVVACHLGIIAHALQRSLKWDANKQEFPGDEEANRLRDYARRQPWQL